jgi:hypothetical protein
MQVAQNGLEIDRQIYCAKRLHVNSLIHAAKSDYYSSMVQENSQNSKALFKVIDKLLHRNRQSPLPDCDSDEQLATKFSEFFTNKIQTIRAGIGNHTMSATTQTDLGYRESSLSCFNPATAGDLQSPHGIPIQAL